MSKNIMILLLFLLLVSVSCSKGADNPLSNQMDTDLMSLSDAQGTGGTGLLGAYTLSINLANKQFELTPVRSSSLGEAYIVSGLAYFDISPCPDCLRMKGFGIDPDGDIVLKFSVKHPFQKGNTSQPPSAKNRLDLDVFDLALAMKAVNSRKYHTGLICVGYVGLMKNADFYTIELLDAGSSYPPPFKICYENQNNNRFEMGTDWKDFDVILYRDIFDGSKTVDLELFLTMAYGFSAKKDQRLNPTYYVPEFNRKPAWKVVVNPITFTDDQPSTVTIDVYDWNHGATVAADYPDPDHPDQILLPSDIERVTVEVPHMRNEIVEAATVDTSTNGWDDPLTYSATFYNENRLPSGKYFGLVTVHDSRYTGVSVVGGETDTIVHTPDGINLEWYDYADQVKFRAYQDFEVTVVRSDAVGTSETISWGGVSEDYISETHVNIVATDKAGNIHVIGKFSDAVDFDPGPGVDLRTPEDTVGNWTDDLYWSKFDSNLNRIWTKTLSSDDSEECFDIGFDSANNAYLCGSFRGFLDFDPGSGETSRYGGQFESDAYLAKYDSNGNFLWVNTWGGTTVYTDDVANQVIVDNSNIPYVCGTYQGNSDFDPGPGYEWHSTILCDLPYKWSTGAYLLSFNPDGTFRDVATWGEECDSLATPLFMEFDISEDIVLAGEFCDGPTDFDPGPGVDNRSPYGGSSNDIFFHKLDKNGNHLRFMQWGGTSQERLWGFHLDNSKNLIFFGSYVNDVDFDPGPGQDIHFGHDEENYICKLDSNWNYLWGNVYPFDITVPDIYTDFQIHSLTSDNIGNIYFTGHFIYAVDMDGKSTEYWHAAAGEADCFMNKINPNGGYLWTQSWGSQFGECGGAALCIDSSSNVFLTGTYIGYVDFKAGPAEDIRYTNNIDIFLMKFTE